VRIAQFALAEIGKPYRYGGETSAEGFDCSGLTSFVHAREGVGIPRTAIAQYERGERVGRRELRAGDLVFFRFGGRRVDHVGVYTGDGDFVHSPRPGERVQRASLDAPWFEQRFAGAARYWRE
jgi:murein DD-endopeptidase